MENIRLNLTIKATPEKIYDAVTTEKGLSGWWAKETKAKPEVGFINTFTFGDFTMKMKVTKLLPSKTVEWTCIESVDEWIGTFVSFELEEKKEKTLLRFTHGNWNSATDMFASCSYDWATFMTSLKSLCETGTGAPS